MTGVMRDDELDLLHNAELKEAFDEFDKVEHFNILRKQFLVKVPTPIKAL